ncbi:MAG: small subunit ribosomal protein [Acidimicrobiia bacterium]|nr:small subunit ribosomal protein [Acidimicrobiia bacterium]
MAVITMRELLQAGVHFGHQTRRWNPKMKRFIHGERNGIYIIDLEQSLTRIETAYNFVRDLAANGGSILFVGTKKQAQDAVRSYAERCGMPYVNERWLGGMLTNFQTIVKRVGKMKEYQRMRDSGELGMLPKKEALLLSRELEKLERNLSGIRDLEKLPQAIFVIDTKKEAIAVFEANKLGIPIVAVVDTNCDPDIIQYVIPGNDDAIRAGNLMCRVISDAVEEGRFIRSRRTGGGAGPALRNEDEERRILAEQAEARRLAAQQAAEREARVAARLSEPRTAAPAVGAETSAQPGPTTTVAEPEAEASDVGAAQGDAVDAVQSGDA